MSDTVISVENLSKCYLIGRNRQEERYHSLRDSVIRYGSHLARKTLQIVRGRPIVHGDIVEQFWALKDVSFEVKKGEVLGIIGRNGAGKSTLLKILSRITDPSKGRVVMTGRVASLLEVGTGFHPELSGRENIFLNGAILGMSAVEIKKKFDEIVSFAEVELFLDTPVKRYSSGMYVRLAFSVAAHLETDILVVDEVLAVGDAEFQKKCMGKMHDAAQGGRTVLLVSHNMSIIQRLCSHAVFLENGSLIEKNNVSRVVQNFYATNQSNETGTFRTTQREGTGWARILDFRLLSPTNCTTSSVSADEDLIFETSLKVVGKDSSHLSLRGLVVEIMFYDENGCALTSIMNVDDGGAELPNLQYCLVRTRIKSPFFIQGNYRINLFLGIPFSQHVDILTDALSFEVLPPTTPWRPYPLSPKRGYFVGQAQWSIETQKTEPHHENIA
jgi:lipopolysaccharide transport system ATP-binding protein